MPRPEFRPTHRLHVRTRDGEGDVLVQLDPNRDGRGPAWSQEAWEYGRGPDFWLTESRWVFVGHGPGTVVIGVREGHKMAPVRRR